MSDEKRHEAKTDSDWLANIYEMLAEDDTLSLDDVKEAIREEGDDPDALIARGMDFIEQQRKLATQRMLEEARENKKAVLENVMKIPKHDLTFDQLREKVKHVWASLSEAPGGTLQAAYRNLENLTEQDLQSLLKDLEFVSELNREEKEKGD
ncbi:MAG: hypothetical protein NPIRA03_25840 [Nitrospirales bacterium]|nr:MAG: hypothetical protein NPIRA03_25840 [Nitrospirales bacterium]